MSNNKKILVICPHPVGYAPGQRLKYEQYFKHWQNNGYDVTVRSFMSEKTQNIIYKKGYFFQKAAGVLLGYSKRVVDLFNLRKYDLVYVFLWVTPIGIPFFEMLVCKLAKKIIYDIDDLVFLKHDIAEPWYALHIKGRNKPAYMMKKANHVITCTPFLDEYAKQFNNNTTDISSTINTDTYTPVNNYANTKKIIVGWSGSHSTVRMLLTIAPALQSLAKTLQYKLLVMGSKDVEIEGVDIEAIEWTEENEIKTLQKMDIGLYPLPNEEWVKGKSGLKALQYMALGIPTVATNIGCNPRVIENNVSGFLVNSPEEWIQKITMLANNPELRKTIGLASRERVEKMYSIKANEPLYLKIINDVCSGNLKS